MDKNNDRDIFITTDDGRELKFKILFTYHSDNFGKDYVFIYDEEDEENIQVYPYDENHNFYTIEDEEEWKELEEVLQAYEEEQIAKEENN